ncbi:putative vacuolar amino acid transporter YPQ3 [Glycine max]|nr:putative vacuolar amino acid transporter YPQ3 [Glycine max]
MGVFENSTLSLWCQSNQHCSQLAKEHMGSVRETPSFLLGLISVIVWVVAEIPQIIPNYRTKSAEGLSVTFLVTWIIGDLFNLFGCMLEPATVETFTKVGQLEKASDAEQSIQVDGSNRGTGLSSPIPLPARPQRISTGRELFYQSARYLSKSHTPTAGSILAQKPPTLDSIQESLLGSTIVTQSAPALKMKNTLCLVSTLNFLGVINLLQPLDERINSMTSNPRQQLVSDDQLPKTDVSGSSSVGTFFGWAMDIYIFEWKTIRRVHVEGLNPLMFLFAVIGNATYVASCDQPGLVKNQTEFAMASRCWGILYIFAVGPPKPCRAITNINCCVLRKKQGFSGISHSLTLCVCEQACMCSIWYLFVHTVYLDF